MAIVLGAYTFDAAHTAVKERLEEVGGRNERRIEISGLIAGKNAVSAIEAELDAILDAASPDVTVSLSLRAGRQLAVRRSAFTRGIRADALLGSFTLELAAEDPFEESQTLNTVSWSITASGATKAVSSSGSMFSKPVISLLAIGAVINPAFSDGVRTIRYEGSIADGQQIVFDATRSVVLLDDVDVTPYTVGLFPIIEPEGTVLTYTDDAASSHTASVSISYRDRWW